MTTTYPGKQVADREIPFDDRDNALYKLGMASANLSEPLRMLEGLRAGYLSFTREQVDRAISDVEDAFSHIGCVVDIIGNMGREKK